MKLGIKLALSTICVVSVLFGLCGGALNFMNFQNTLDRELDSAKQSYISLLETLGVLGGAGILDQDADMAEVLSKYGSGYGSWAAIRLTLNGEVLYEADGNSLFSKISKESEGVKPDSISLGQADDERADDADSRAVNAATASSADDASSSANIGLRRIDGRMLVYVDGQSSIKSDPVMLEMVRDISLIYSTRLDELHMFTMVFVILVIATAIAAFLSAYVITRPLSRLSRATREIAANNLGSRSMVRTDDEIGALSKDFDDMVGRLEAGVNEMQSMLNRQKRFMGSFAHEMKTPMTSVIGYADLIRQGMLDDDDSEKAAQYMFHEGKRLESLSSKLLQMFLVEEGDIDTNEQPIDVLANDVLEPLRKPFSEMGIELIWNISPASLDIDETLVRSLLVNLVENAKRAVMDVEKPRILVKGLQKDDYYELSVTDNGLGIAKEDLGRITEEFYRADKARSRKSGGAGLGLSLCLRIMQAHGGTLSIGSSVGKGTCSRARFPYMESQEGEKR